MSTSTAEVHTCGAEMTEDGRRCTHCDVYCPMVIDGAGCTKCASQMQYEELGVLLQTSAMYWAGIDHMVKRWQGEREDGATWFTHPRG